MFERMAKLSRGFGADRPKGEKSMMTLLFAIFLVAMILALAGQNHGSLVAAGISLLLCVYWLLHHSTDKLNIQL